MIEKGAQFSAYRLLSDTYLDRLYRRQPQNWGEIAKSYVRRCADAATVGADLFWIEKELFPFLPGQIETLLRLRRIPYVVDMDDAIFHGYQYHRNPIVRTLLASKLKGLLRHSAWVTAGNSYLADYARRAGARSVDVIPTVIAGERYTVTPPSPGGRIRVGWIGTPSNAAYLRPVVRALAALAPQKGFTLVTVGIDPLPDVPDSIRLECHPWSESTEAQLVASFDIGVMPLADSPWERGKCGYKLIQYMAAGRPVVASAVGVNRDIVTEEVGRLVEADGDWTAALALLANNPALREKMGAAARRRVDQHYSLAVTAPIIADRFARIIDAASGRSRVGVLEDKSFPS